ncbi:MAG: hypothetical protein ACRD19_10150 [Terriglobia bacterium]
MMSLEIKEVIQIARKQFVELLPDLAIAPPSKLPAKSKITPNTNRLIDTVLEYRAKDVRLEELEKEGENWAVTLSVPNPDFKPGDLLEGIRHARQLARVAKVVVIDGKEGKLVALRERAA